MRPEDIQHRDFLVGMRGYDKDDVRSFLAEIAAEHGALQAELEAARSVAAAPLPVAATPEQDDFENLGASVAAILRAAKGSAAEVTQDAEAQAQAVREEADTYAASLRQQADNIRSAASDAAADTRARAEAMADELRAAAQASLDEAHAEAERILRDASDKARGIEIETEARLRNKVEALLADAEGRINEAQAREATLRSRLQDANEELQLALMALGDARNPDTVLADLRDSAEVHVDVNEAPAWSESESV
jgi:DivIVA domain-containing protein